MLRELLFWVRLWKLRHNKKFEKLMLNDKSISFLFEKLKLECLEAEVVSQTVGIGTRICICVTLSLKKENDIVSKEVWFYMENYKDIQILVALHQCRRENKITVVLKDSLLYAITGIQMVNTMNDLVMIVDGIDGRNGSRKPVLEGTVRMLKMRDLLAELLVRTYTVEHILTWQI
ncbi:MAG: hypothetical protein FWF46_00560 [Oscillospiraceae bacterium]|nr:hypothetical protein [Oscillospiraceae bacterium]